MITILKKINCQVGYTQIQYLQNYLKCFEKVNKIKIPYIFTERREGDNGIVVANNEKVIKVLKWRPKRTIEEMCQDGWKWQFNNPKGY